MLEHVLTLAVDLNNTVMLCTDRGKKYKMISFSLEDGGSSFRRNIDTCLAECLKGRNLNFNKNVSSNSVIHVCDQPRGLVVRASGY